MAKIKHASQVGHHARTADVRELGVTSTDSVIGEHGVRAIAGYNRFPMTNLQIGAANRG